MKSSGSRNEEYRRTYRDAVQPYIAQPVLAIGVFNRAGGLGRMGMAKVSPLLSMVMSSRAKKQSGDLPTSVIVAVTADKAHVFSYKPTRSTPKIDQELVAWDRQGMTVRTEQTMTATRLHLDLADGKTIELEWLKAGGDFNDEAVEALSAPVS